MLISGTEIIDTDVTGKNCDLGALTMIGIVSGKGDARKPKSCSLPLGLGTFSDLDWRLGPGSHSGLGSRRAGALTGASWVRALR